MRQFCIEVDCEVIVVAVNVAILTVIRDSKGSIVFVPEQVFCLMTNMINVRNERFELS